MKYLRRGSGYYIDVGASELVADGNIKLGGTVDHLTEDAVVMADGTELPADLVVYATGYGSMNGWVADLISQDVADKVGKVWGLGSDTTKDPGPWEGEQRNMWKPTQQEALGSMVGTSRSRATIPCTSRCSSRRASRGSTRRSTGCRRCTTSADGGPPLETAGWTALMATPPLPSEHSPAADPPGRGASPTASRRRWQCPRAPRVAARGDRPAIARSPHDASTLRR